MLLSCVSLLMNSVPRPSESPAQAGPITLHTQPSRSARVINSESLT